MPTLSREQLAVLQHSLGLDEHGRPLHRGPGYSRNYFATDRDGPDGGACEALVALGLMADRGARAIADGMHVYVVTDAGREAVATQSPPPPKVSRSRARYLRWLEIADCFDFGFGEWLRRGYDREVA